MKLFLIVTEVAVLALALTQYLRSSQFAGMIENLGRRLTATQHDSRNPPQVPAIMQAFALRNGGRVGGPTTVIMSQAAEMRLAVDQPFFKLDASQLSATRTPGFVWQAKGTMTGIVPLSIVDSYVDGMGLLEVRIASSIPVATSTGPETAKGEDGDIVAIDAEERPRAGGTPARWVGRFERYVQGGAYRFPHHGEIAWDLPEG